ncbi:hypothetical protein B0H10DRAFT_2224949 [Mycena sp. CBHHK59/15]|nr:hypothetical protein B0H10DRAFT_2224949 [Mycena sp. CBHHK59/15]
MSTLIVPTGFSYVTAALMSTIFLLGGQIVAVSRHRSFAGSLILNVNDEPPSVTLSTILTLFAVYADKAEAAASPAAYKFNCAQRVHQNTLEYLPGLYMMTTVFGLKYPVLAASSLGLWVVGRIAYSIGYMTGVPDNRNNIVTVICATPSMLTLLGGSTYTAYRLLVEGI